MPVRPIEPAGRANPLRRRSKPFVIPKPLLPAVEGEEKFRRRPSQEPFADVLKRKQRGK